MEHGTSEWKRFKLNFAINHKFKKETIDRLYEEWWGDHSWCMCGEKTHNPNWVRPPRPECDHDWIAIYGGSIVETTKTLKGYNCRKCGKQCQN